MKVFPDCGSEPLGLYPIVDNAEWLEKLLPLGVKTVQLRIKDKQGIELENEIKRAVTLARKFDTRLFINDYWDMAVACGAYGVHLGQEDLAHADIEKIHEAGLRLGVSTHCEEEIARANAVCPSYMAYGPIYLTTSKIMPFKPQGLLALKQLKQVSPYPLVAIGGINLERLPAVLETGVDGVAMISAITQADDPVAMTEKLLAVVEKF